MKLSLWIKIPVVFIALVAALAFGIWLVVQETFFIVHPQDKEIVWAAEGRDPFDVEYPSTDQIRRKIVGNTGYAVTKASRNQYGSGRNYDAYQSRFYFFLDQKYVAFGQSNLLINQTAQFAFGEGEWFLSPRVETMKDGWRVKIRIVNFFCIVNASDIFGPVCRAIRNIRYPTFWTFLEEFHTGDVASNSSGLRVGKKPLPAWDVTRPKSFQEVMNFLKENNYFE